VDHLALAKADVMSQRSPLAELYGKLPQGWEAWTGIGGLLYARRRNSSPAIVVRSATAEDLAAKVEQAEKESQQRKRH
jgi:hypothetical protein